MGQRSETLLALMAVAVVAIMLLPLPAVVLDLLLSLSISIALVIFLFALHIEKPLEFSAFPSLLLLTTLMRLALNIASTRLILLHGNEGVGAAGQVIRAFGQFAVGGNIIVGITVFLLLVIINFVVITKGSGRIAEVAARFTLDSMPGKQMSTDADLAAGLITEEEARRRRRTIEQEADFFGSMDGAGKFVRGDAVAGVLIMVVNVVGGLLVGSLQRGMPLAQAARTYVALTIGDGLVTQVPALLTSIAAGLVTTRASAGAPLGRALTEQLFGTERTLTAAALILAFLGIVPGMPFLSFFAIAALLGTTAYRLRRKPAPDARPEARQERREVERIEVESALPLELLQVEVGLELVPLIDTAKGGPLMHRVAGLRRQLAQDIGIIIPPVHMRDNLRLGSQEYRLLLLGNPLGGGQLRPGRQLAIHTQQVAGHIPGESCHDPAFQLPARWILESDRPEAELAGCTVVDAATVAATHLGELLGANARDLLGRREAQELLDIHGRNFGKVIEELIPSQLSMAAFIKVLRSLLHERVSVRDFRTILEALADHAGEVKDADLLTEQVRQRLAKQLTRRHQTGDGTVPALVLAPEVESIFRRMQGTGQGPVDPTELNRLTGDFEAVQQTIRQAPQAPVVLCTADIRRTVASFSRRILPQLSVLSFREIDSQANVRTVAIIGRPQVELRHAV